MVWFGRFLVKLKYALKYQTVFVLFTSRLVQKLSFTAESTSHNFYVLHCHKKMLNVLSWLILTMIPSNVGENCTKQGSLKLNHVTHWMSVGDALFFVGDILSTVLLSKIKIFLCREKVQNKPLYQRRATNVFLNGLM